MIRPLLAVFVIHFSLFVSVAHSQVLRHEIDITKSRTDYIDTINIDWQHEQLLIPVKTEGKTLNFLLDTGAGTCVTYSDAPVKGSKQVGVIPTVDAVGHRDTVPLVTLPPLTIGTVTYSGKWSPGKD